MNHKKRRVLHQRAHCMCKYWKDERVNKRAKGMARASDYRTYQEPVPRPGDAVVHEQLDEYALSFWELDY